MITVLGLDGSPLTAGDSAVLAGATLVVGGRRQLAAARSQGWCGSPEKAAVVELGPLAPALAALAGHDGEAVVLASGDPGFFGILRALRERGLDCAVRPAVSSVAEAFARAGLTWDDAQVVSAHGRDPRRAVNLCRAHPKVAVLTSPDYGPAELGAALDGWDRRLIVAEHLGAPAERVTACTAAEAAGRSWQDPNVVIVLAGALPSTAPSDLPLTGPGDLPLAGPDGAALNDLDGAALAGAGDLQSAGPGGPVWRWPPGGTGGGWALPEDEFEQTDAVMTKSEVRAVALARLAPGPGRLIWDVGAGTGSVGIECARLGAAVIAIERDPRRAKLVRENALRHGVDVRVVEGEALGALDGLPAMDAAYIGGGGPGVVEAVVSRRPATAVVALAAVERVGPACSALDAAGYTVNGTLLQASRISPLPGGVHRFEAVNPVFLLWGTRSEGKPKDHPGQPEGAS